MTIPSFNPLGPESTLGPYRVIEPIGSGGMGEVLLARDPRLDRWVAIKRIHLSSARDERRQRLLREAKLAASLKHEAIVQVYDLLTIDDVDHIVMEYVDGESLNARLLRQPPLEFGEKLRIAAAIAQGLAYAHRHGVIHRDLKTENVLVDEEGRVKIVDFGIARRATPDETEESLTRTGALLGTVRAMSPEQARGDTADERSDLFSFGVLIYELFVEASPFASGNPLQTIQKIIGQPHSSATSINPDLPEALGTLIDHLLEKAPENRPENAEAVARLLSPW
ncbi:MAG: serine/threonine-protein kinase, partial [Acidobacteriota bacterium]